MPIGQLIYFPADGDIQVKYNQKKDAKYSGQPDKPIESMMWKNKFWQRIDTNQGEFTPIGIPGLLRLLFV